MATSAWRTAWVSDESRFLLQLHSASGHTFLYLVETVLWCLQRYFTQTGPIWYKFKELFRHSVTVMWSCSHIFVQQCSEMTSYFHRIMLAHQDWQLLSSKLTILQCYHQLRPNRHIWLILSIFGMNWTDTCITTTCSSATAEWDNIPQQTIRTLISSMGRLCQAVIDGREDTLDTELLWLWSSYIL